MTSRAAEVVQTHPISKGAGFRVTPEHLPYATDVLSDRRRRPTSRGRIPANRFPGAGAAEGYRHSVLSAPPPTAIDPRASPGLTWAAWTRRSPRPFGCRVFPWCTHYTP